MEGKRQIDSVTKTRIFSKRNICAGFSELRYDFLDFLDYIKCNKTMVILTWFFILLSYGMRIFYFNPMMDTASGITDFSGITHSWFTFGRFALTSTKKIFGLQPYCDYAENFLMICTMFILCILFSYIVWKFLNLEEKRQRFNWIFPIIFITSPVFAGQFNFSIQSFEIAFAMTICGLAAFLISKWIINSKNIVYLVLGMICMVWALGSYQAIFSLYIVFALACYILIYISNCQGRINLKKYFFRTAVIKYTLTFFAGSAIYFVFDKLFKYVYGSSDYATNLIRWGTRSTTDCLSSIKVYMHSCFFGDGGLYSEIFLFIFLIIIIYALCSIVSKKSTNKILFFLSLIVFSIMPFSMSIVLGDMLESRMQMCYQFVIGFVLAMIVYYLGRIKFNKTQFVAVILCFMIALDQSYTMARLFDTERMKYDQDVILSQQIIESINDLNLGEIPDYPVVLVGAHEADVPTGMYADAIGFSWFDYNRDPEYALLLFELMGYDYSFPTSSQMQEGQKYAQENMPCWPDPASVQLVNDEMIVVKLSDKISQPMCVQ